MLLLQDTIRQVWEEHAVRLHRWPWSPPSSQPLPPIFESVDEFVGIVTDCLSAHKNVLITRNFHKASAGDALCELDSTLKSLV